MRICTSRLVRPALLAIAAASALAGCGSTAATPSVVPTPPPTATPEASPSESATSSVDSRQWLAVELTDVATGEKFAIADIPDLILVQGLTRSSAECKSQAEELKKLRRAWDGEGLTIVSLDLDAADDPASLKAYAAAAGYDWRFAVAPADVVSALGQLYGAQSVDPASAPMWLVTLGGSALSLPPGVKSAQDLQDTATGSTGV
jgi:hypothetical protein